MEISFLDFVIYTSIKLGEKYFDSGNSSKTFFVIWPLPTGYDFKGLKLVSNISEENVKPEKFSLIFFYYYKIPSVYQTNLIVGRRDALGDWIEYKAMHLHPLCEMKGP